MDNILPIIAGGALVLACPLGMVAMGVVPWLMARAPWAKEAAFRGLHTGARRRAYRAHENGDLKDHATRPELEIHPLLAQATTGRNEP